MALDRERRAVFEGYLNYQYEQEGAITFGQKLEVVRRLEREAREKGLVPVADGQCAKVNVNDPAVRAILEGRSVSLGGGKEASARRGGGLQNMSTAAKLGVMAAILLLPLIIGILFFMLSGGEEEEVAVATPTPTGTITATPTQTTTPTLTPTVNVGPGQARKPTPTPYNVQLYVDNSADKGNDPASVEIAGNSFVLGESEPKNGVWTPKAGGEWLKQSEVRRVLAIPYSPELGTLAQTMSAGDPLLLRLRSGEVVEYRFNRAERVKRQQIEVLSKHIPSMAIVLYGERAGDRWVITADAVQKPDDFSDYIAASSVISGILPLTGTVTAYPTPTPEITPIAALAQTIITETLVVTNPMAKLSLSVDNCSRVVQVGTSKPPKAAWQFISCQVTLTATEDDAYYSGFSLGATEMDWITATEGWWPQPVSVPEAIGEGYLNEEEQITGKVAGIIIKKQQLPGGPRSWPIVVWEQSALRFIIDVDDLLE